MNVRLWRPILVCLFLLLLSGTALAENQHVLLIDQSGSMRPFYEHPDRRLHRFLQELTQQKAVFADGDRVSITLFSELNAAHVVFQGTAAELRRRWADVESELTVVNKNTHLTAGLLSGVQQAAESKVDGARFIWFLTDNVAEGDSAADQKNTQEFYQDLKSKPEFQSLSHIQVFPVDLQHPTETKGLMLYGMLWAQQGTAAGPLADQQDAYRKATGNLAKAGLKEFMGQPPFLVKPLTESPFRLELTQFVKEGGKPIPIEVKNGVVHLPSGLFREGEPIRGTLTGQLVSNYETFKVPDATLRAELGDPRTVAFKPVKPGLQRIEPERLGALPARSSSQPLKVTMALPPLEASWSLASVLTGTGGDVEADMTLSAQLPAGGLQIDTSRISHLTFHRMTELPQLFGTDVTVLPVRVTLDVPVRYSGTRFWVALLLVILAIAAFLALAYALWRYLAYRWEWLLTPVSPAGEPTTLYFSRLTHRRHDLFWEGCFLGSLTRSSATGLTFHPSDGTENVVLEGGGDFSTSADNTTLLYRVDPVATPMKGDTNDAA